MSSLNDTPSGERIRIGFFGSRNAGKSSLINAVTGQDLAVVSDVPGTTTDAVRKAMELLPLGPVVLIDTPGLDDSGALGEERVRRAKKELATADLAVLVYDAEKGLQKEDDALIALFRDRRMPYVIVANKCDLLPAGSKLPSADGTEVVSVSAKTGDGIDTLKNKLAGAASGIVRERPLVSDLVASGALCALVIPIDDSAPKGRIILPQQMVLRDLLDHHCRVICLQPEELPALFSAENTASKELPDLVITDSQVFEAVADAVPDEVPLTSFSILLARYKGTLTPLIRGAEAIRNLRDGDRVLIAESCTHHRQCEDIGTVKLPNWIRKETGQSPSFETCSGKDYPEDLGVYRLILHCGGCMLTEGEMQHRLRIAEEAGIPIVNYGIAIASLKGILPRALAPFGSFER